MENDNRSIGTLLLYIGLFFVACFGILFLGIAVLDLIDILFAKPEAFGSYSPRESLNFAMPVYIVLLPLLFWMTGRARKKISGTEPVRGRVGSISLIIFFAFVILIIDLIVLLWSLFSGDLLLNFSLKVIAVAVIAAVVLFYYRRDLKNEWSSNTSAHKIFVWVVSIVLIVITVVGISNGGILLQREDKLKVEQLSNIFFFVQTHYRTNNEIPSFEKLRSENYNISQNPDVEDGVEYYVKSADTIELCARFNLSGSTPYGQWNHTEGRNCFTKEIFK
ncbi:MAG: hypothetical protein OXU73_02935 [Candidatus Campbellbacteria bacterium]|nr:hypothetical protein [Candidatus Campbellbacteria bacterium]